MQEIAVPLMLLSFLAMPFALVAALSRELAMERQNVRYGWWLFAGGSCLFVLNWLWGAVVAGQYETREMWTAASFARAMILPRSVVVVFLCWAARGALGKRS